MQDKFGRIFDKSLGGGRLTPEEGVSLYACDLPRLGHAAGKIAKKRYPQGRVTFVVGRNISYTNGCVVDCDFCAFHCHPDHKEAFILGEEEIFRKVDELVSLGGTQVLIQGGVNPKLSLDYYLGILKGIRRRFPTVHIHSFSPVEFDMMARRFGMGLAELLGLFKESGLHSLPGGGSEILVDRVRRMISPRKITADRWLEIMRTAHGIGLRSTATMVFGHCETLEERILHLTKIRQLQDQTGGFRAFIPWTLSPKGTPRMSHFKTSYGEDYLKTVAISRLMLDNVEHIQAGWLTEGLKMAQMALCFGCDDMGGTLLEDKVLEPTGVEAGLCAEDLVRAIREAGYHPAKRNTNYDILCDFDALAQS